MILKDSIKKQIMGYGRMGEAGIKKAIGQITGDPKITESSEKAYDESQQLLREAEESREKELGMQSVFNKHCSDPKLCEEYYYRLKFLDRKIEIAHGEKVLRAAIAERLLLKERLIAMGLPEEMIVEDPDFEEALEAYIRRRYLTFRMLMARHKRKLLAEIDPADEEDGSGVSEP